MHIVIEDNKKHRVIACVERSAGHAQIIASCCEAHMQQMELALKGLGVPAVLMHVMGVPAVEWLKSLGWEEHKDSHVMVKELK